MRERTWKRARTYFETLYLKHCPTLLARSRVPFSSGEPYYVYCTRLEIDVFFFFFPENKNNNANNNSCALCVFLVHWRRKFENICQFTTCLSAVFWKKTIAPSNWLRDVLSPVVSLYSLFYVRRDFAMFFPAAFSRRSDDAQCEIFETLLNFIRSDIIACELRLIWTSSGGVTRPKQKERNRKGNDV